MSHTCSQKDIRKQKKQPKSYSKRLTYDKSQRSTSGTNKLTKQLVHKQKMSTGKGKTRRLYCSEIPSDSRKGDTLVQCNACVQWTHTECVARVRLRSGMSSPATSAMMISR